MKFFYLLLVLSFSVVICAESEETSRYSRYEGACPGNIDDSSKSFGSFVQKYFNNSETTILGKCLPEYFKNYTNLELGDVESCVKPVQEFMWDRCHWRLLYNVNQNNTVVMKYLNTLPSGAEVLDLLEAMNENEAIYKFATKFGSWDWAGIGIMLLCAFFGSYIILWIIGGIMYLTKKKQPKEEKTEKTD